LALEEAFLSNNNGRLRETGESRRGNVWQSVQSAAQEIGAFGSSQENQAGYGRRGRA